MRRVQWWSVSMVTRYDVISSRWSSHFERKCMFFFQLFSTIKVNLVAKIMQSAYLCIIIHVKQLPSLAVLTRFLILGKIQDGGQDGGHWWWRHRPPAAKLYLILLRRSKAFQWRQNRFETLQHIKNSGERFHLPSSCTLVGGMILRVRPRVKWFFKTLARYWLVLYEITLFH